MTKSNKTHTIKSKIASFDLTLCTREEPKWQIKRVFSLIELVIVIVIIGILTVIALPIYRGYAKKAMATEGKALLGAVLTAQKVYFSEFNRFVTGTQSVLLGIDPAANKYFTTFSLTGSTSGFTAVTTGTGNASGILLSLVGSSTVAADITEVGL